jgi:hypothetical protein
VPNPTHRIDLLVVPVEPECSLEEAALVRLRRLWEVDGLLAGESAGDESSDLVAGGFSRLWLDRPGCMVLYANQQGGFRVTCPDNGKNIAPGFGAALGAWRDGGERSMECPACGKVHALDICVLAPPGAFGRSAIVFGDAGGVDLSDRARTDLLHHIGDFRVVIRRRI